MCVFVCADIFIVSFTDDCNANDDIRFGRLESNVIGSKLSRSCARSFAK